MEATEAAEGGALDADNRLARLAARRAAAAAVNRRSSTGSGAGSDCEEGEASLPPLRGAVLALRELLQQRQGAFDAVAAATPGCEPPVLELAPAQQGPRAATPDSRPGSWPNSRATTPSRQQKQQQQSSRPASAATHQRAATPAGSRPGSAASAARRCATPGGTRAEAARPSSQLAPAACDTLEAVQAAEVRSGCVCVFCRCLRLPSVRCLTLECPPASPQPPSAARRPRRPAGAPAGGSGGAAAPAPAAAGAAAAGAPGAGLAPHGRM